MINLYCISLILSSLFLMLGCNKKKEQNIIKNEPEVVTNIDIKANKEQYQNSFKKDTTLEKGKAFGFIKVSNSFRTDSLLSFCYCEKDTKNNRIKIQIKTAIPTKRELDTMSMDSMKRTRLMQLADYGYKNKVKGQFKFLKIVLKDSIVESVNLYSKSTEREYNGTDFDSLSIENYKINVSKFDYKIASEIYGNFKFKLKRGFGFFENDTILSGEFLCTNGQVLSIEQIKQWDIKESFKHRNGSGLVVPR